jgi:hypothetical protein
VVVKYFRTPYTALQNARVVALTKELGMPIIYGPGSNDDSGTSDATAIINTMLTYLKRDTDGQVTVNPVRRWQFFINHDAHWAGKILDSTAHKNLLKTNFFTLLRNGTNNYEFLTISEMVDKRGSNGLIPGEIYGEPDGFENVPADRQL